MKASPERGASVLSGPDDAPLLVLSREGKGRVALLLTDQMWLWARGFEGGGPYEDLMRRTAHWLMKEPDLEEEALRATAHGRDLTLERQTLDDKSGPIHLVAPSGKAQDVTPAQAAPGLFRAELKAREFGLYRASQGDLKALVNVGPENPLEYRDVVSTTEKLRPLAEASGGSVRRIGDGWNQRDSPAARRRHGRQPGLCRRGFHRHTPHRIEHGARRQADPAGDRLARPAAAARRPGRGLGVGRAAGATRQPKLGVEI